MFDFVQHKSCLLGNSAAISELAHKESARILVLSDSHGNASVIREILRRFGSTSDALCFCGDGSTDVLSALAFFHGNENLAKCLPPVVALVQGNGDTPTTSIHIAEKPHTFHVPQTKLLVAAGKILFLTHGHLYNVYYGNKELHYAAKCEKAAVALFGHTHIPYAKQEGDVLLLNPGSCARPRRGTPNSFAILTIAPNVMDYQFIAITGDMQFEPYTPPYEDFSLLWS